ncbi:MAG: hypothetical protein J5I93_00075 [Pirellulaceae bacterium]|nr:hypothetical protein [Pirellulaceae bacterium]
MATSWIPSERLRQWAMWGALAAGIDVALLSSGAAAEFLQPQGAGGVPLSDILDALVLLPELMVLAALVAVARDIRSLGLWRGSIGYFGCSWLFIPLLFVSDEDDGSRALIAGLVVLVGMIVLLVVVSRKPQVFSEPEPVRAGRDDQDDWPPRRDDVFAQPAGEQEDRTETEPPVASSDKSATGEAAGRAWGCGTTLAVLTLVRLLTRGLRNAKIEWEILVPVAGFGFLLACATVFAIWFGLAKIRARGKLGTMAVVSGAADLLFVCGMLATVAVGLVILLPRILEGEAIEDDAGMTWAVHAITLLDIIAKLMTGLLLVAVWRREEDPWEAELSRSRRDR